MDIFAASRISHPPMSSAYGPDGRSKVNPVGSLEQAFRSQRDAYNGKPQVENPLYRAGEIQFRIDKEAGRLVVSIFDEQGALLRQIPGDVVLEMAKRLKQVLSDGSLGLHAEA